MTALDPREDRVEIDATIKEWLVRTMQDGRLAEVTHARPDFNQLGDNIQCFSFWIVKVETSNGKHNLTSLISMAE